MYVIVLIIDGELKKTASRNHPQEALDIAQEWVTRNRNKQKNGYIAIEEKVRGKDENRKFAKVTFDDEDNIKYYPREKGENPLLSSRISPVFKTFMITIMEFALTEFKDYMKDQRTDPRPRRDNRY